MSYRPFNPLAVKPYNVNRCGGIQFSKSCITMQQYKMMYHLPSHNDRFMSPTYLEFPAMICLSGRGGYVNDKQDYYRCMVEGIDVITCKKIPLNEFFKSRGADGKY